MLDLRIKISVLYDIYSSLLTSRQQDILSLYYSNDYSLGEIAEEYNISRQAVHDLINRATATLENLEDNLGLYRLFQIQQQLLGNAEKMLEKEQLSEQELGELKDILARLRSTIEQ
ncbi:MAG: YlxM family DNA-binding protein [Bacillota bacterium]